MTEEDKVKKANPVLTAKYRKTQAVFSTLLPNKGSTSDYAWKALIGQMKEWGLAAMDIIIKSDQEPAIMSLCSEVQQLRGRDGLRTAIEHSPVFSKLLIL